MPTLMLAFYCPLFLRQALGMGAAEAGAWLALLGLLQTGSLLGAGKFSDRVR